LIKRIVLFSIGMFFAAANCNSVLLCIEKISYVLLAASFSSCQQNLIKTFQIEAMIALITKMALVFS
jgi:hypothetical protein